MSRRGNAAEAAAQVVMAERANATDDVVTAAPDPSPAAPSTSAKPRAGLVPPGFADTIKEMTYVPRENDAFGAIDVGDMKIQGGPADNGSTPVERVEGEEAEKKGAAADDDDADAGAEGEEAKDEKQEGAEAEGEDKKPDETPPETAKTRREMRREMLDALKYQAKNRELVDEVERANRRAAEAERRAAEAVSRQTAEIEKLKGAPLEERLKFWGVETKEELLELAITGKVVLPEKRPETAKPPAADDRVAHLENELRQHRGEQLIRNEIAGAGLSAHADAITRRAEQKWVAAGSPAGKEMEFVQYAIGVERYVHIFDQELATSEALDIPLARAVPGQLAAIRDAALQAWEAGGFRPGEHARHLAEAANAAEELVREQEAPKFKALGLEMPARGAKAKPVVAAPPPPGAAPAKPAAAPAKVPAKPSAPVGKRVGARGPALDDDGLPLDGAQRDAIIKRDMEKAGHKGWGSSIR